MSQQEFRELVGIDVGLPGFTARQVTGMVGLRAARRRKRPWPERLHRPSPHGHRHDGGISARTKGGKSLCYALSTTL
jgi:hypothetical protein